MYTFIYIIRTIQANDFELYVYGVAGPLLDKVAELNRNHYLSFQMKFKR
jgi:hypothetical protein